MLSTAWTDVIPAEELALLETGRGQEIEQPLIDLGYLNETSIENISTSRHNKLADAIRHFRKDYISAGLLPDYAPNFAQLPLDELDGVELNLIHQLTGLDGEFPILSLPENGTVNLYSRVLHYRLIVFGVFTKNVSSPFDIAAQVAINTLSEWLTAQNTKDILDLIGDFPKLLQRLLDSNKLKRNVVVFKYQTRKAALDAIEEVEEEDEEKDDDTKLMKVEADIEKEITALTATIFSKEEEAIERLEKRNKNKKRRVEKVERCIIKLVDQGKELFESTNIKVMKLEAEKKPLLSQKSLLDSDIIRFDNNIKKEKLKAGPDLKNKTIRRKRKALEKVEKRLKKEKSKAQVVGEISTAEHNLSILNRSVSALENRPGNQKAIIKRLKGQIDAANQEIDQNNKILQRYADAIRLKKELEALRQQAIKNSSDKAVIKSLQQQKKQTQSLRNQVLESIKQKDNKIKAAAIHRDQIIRENQIKIQPLKDRLDRLERKINGLRYRFKAQLSRSLDDDYYDKLKVNVFQGRNKVFLNKLEIKPFNSFLIRLIQVRQWINGYYYGKLDSKAADRTFQSIVELIEEEELKRLRLKYVLTKLGSSTDGFWLLNAQYFFDCVCELESQGSSKNTAELIAAYEAKFDNEPIYKNKVTDAAWKDFTSEIEEGIQETNTQIRRFYYGVKSLARSIGRVIGKIFQLIIKGIKSVIRIFKNFIKILYKEIREGARKFFQGMEFLFGKRQIETTIDLGKTLVTKFDFDFDVTVWAGLDIPADVYKAHIEKCAGYASNMAFSLKLVAKVLKWTFTLASGGLTWPRLALKLAFYFKDLVIQFLVKRRVRKVVGV